MKSAEQLRATLVALDSQLESARNAFVAAQTAHRAALRAEIEGDKATDAAVTASALQARQDEHARVLLAHDLAVEMLAEAAAREKAQAEEESRNTIRAELAEMAELAKAADEDVARLVGKIRRIKAMEIALFAKTRSELGRAPYRAPQANVALRSIASFATQVANSDSDTLPVRPVVSEAVRDSVQNIEGALS